MRPLRTQQRGEVPRSCSRAWDNWQEIPHQRISFKSWCGKTWLFLKGRVSPNYAQLCAAAASPSQTAVSGQCEVSKPVTARRKPRVPSNSFKLTKGLDKPVYGLRPTVFELCCVGNPTLDQITEDKGIVNFRLQQRILTGQANGKMTVFRKSLNA